MMSNFLQDRTYRLETHIFQAPRPVFHQNDTVEHEGHRWIAVRDGGARGTFHLRWVDKESNGSFSLVAGKAHGVMYRPIHRSMTPGDIEGSRYVEDQDGAYLFAHCSPEEQVALAAEARTFATQQFAMAIQKAQTKVDEATNPTNKDRAVVKVKSLVAFAEAVGAAAYATVIGAVLGHYHKDPHNDHLRDLAVEAIAATLAAWKKSALTDTAVATARGHVTTDAGKVTTALTETHTIEWRHARAARLAAEAKAKEAEAAAETETPGSGD